MKDQYRRTFLAVRRELMALSNERKRIDARIAKLEPLVEGLRAFYETEAVKKTKSKEQLLGMTDAVRNALEKAATPMSATEIRERMERWGFDFSSYTNPLASIHTILKRLIVSQEIKVVLHARGKKKYRWVTLPDRLMDALSEIGEVAKAIREAKATESRERSIPNYSHEKRIRTANR